MSLVRKSTGGIDVNDKVMNYLQHSTRYSPTNCSSILEKSNDLYPFQHRLRSSSDNDSLLSSSSSSSAIDSSSRSDISIESSLSDPVAHCSSNRLLDGELDFNIGFDDINNDDDDDDDDDDQHKNNTDAVTLLGEPKLDIRLNELEDILRQMSNNDDTITANHTKSQRATFLHDSTYTLCSQDRFPAYTDDDDEDEQEENQQINRLGIRSNSLSIVQVKDKSKFVEKTSKKIVRFADVMGLDLESIRYMTPPDQTTSSLIQECVRLQLGQIRLSRDQLQIPNLSKRTNSSTSLSSPTNQYNLVSKSFSSPKNIVPMIYDKQIVLECLYTKDSIAYGTARVHNLIYDKNVFVRLTYDEWETSNDIQAWHSMNYSHDNTDAFTFQITLSKSYDTIKGPKRILFAVCLQAMYQDFWDNNEGWNYVLDIFEKR